MPPGLVGTEVVKLVFVVKLNPVKKCRLFLAYFGLFVRIIMPFHEPETLNILPH